MQWLEYCKSSGSGRRLSRVAARALQIHPDEPGLWIYAAAWEFEHNANAAAARALMQQGLRMCQDSPKLWTEYLNMVTRTCVDFVGLTCLFFGLAVDDTVHVPGGQEGGWW